MDLSVQRRGVNLLVRIGKAKRFAPFLLEQASWSAIGKGMENGADKCPGP